MEIKKTYFMTEVTTDQLDMEGNLITINEDVAENDLATFIINNSYAVKVVGHYEKTFSDEIDELKEENMLLKDQLDSINSRVDDALSYLRDVEYELENIEDDSRY